jgi:HAD superfamily hydrolase (TIGR01549 family)
VIFDMDGTLTRPFLDFRRIREEIGLPEPLLETMLALPLGPERNRAFSILERHEDDAAERSELSDGARGVLDFLRARGKRAALVTRNSQKSAARVLEKHALAFDMVVTREDAPVKPRPEPLQLICDRLGVPPAEALMVGDYKYDVIAGRAAGLRTALLLLGDKLPPYLDEVRPDHLLRRLDDLRSLFPS